MALGYSEGDDDRVGVRARQYIFCYILEIELGCLAFGCGGRDGMLEYSGQ